MQNDPLDPIQLRNILIKNWMTHDALWYGEVAANYGMEAASPMNLRVCRKLGRIELKRLMKLLDASGPTEMESYRKLFEFGWQIFVPEFMSFKIDYPDQNCQRFHIKDCFAHKGMEQAGVLSEYECGIFERIEGWFDAMGLNYTRKPDLSRCLKFKGQECIITVELNFETSKGEVK